ncbi:MULTISPECIES: hypothetical protein [unclassified Archaeoglobus]|jgi:hypothetical protein|uniref:hypothetical protein n=1 Tax=unclassified Archaeoglobus TaxID=2643606 RepID=UPI0025BE352C|nr:MULTISPECIES: hypothetical protein [unclassified Archaeoglobus]
MGTIWCKSKGDVLKELVKRLEHLEKQGAKISKMKVLKEMRKIVGIAKNNKEIFFFVANFNSKYVFTAAYKSLEELKDAAVAPYVPYFEFPVDVIGFFSAYEEVSGLEEALNKLNLEAELLANLI